MSEQYCNGHVVRPGRGEASGTFMEEGSRRYESKSKIRNRGPGLAGQLIGKRIKTPGLLSSEYPRFKALERYRKEAWSAEKP